MPKGCYSRKPRFYPIEPDSPIDDTLTQARLGYAATTVSPSSTAKKVTFLCARCQAPVDRIRYRVKPGTLCRSCAHAKDDAPVKHPLKSGYEKVEVPCAGCGKTIQVRKMSLHEGSSCPACRKKSKIVPNKYIDAEETKRRFGYDGAKVTSKSFDKVVVRCAKCEEVFERIRRNVTEEPVCEACSYVNRDTNPNKRLKTLWKRYGTTNVSVHTSGKAEKYFGTCIAELIGRSLQTQYTLPGGKSVDFYDAQTNIGLEYCGLRWHHEMNSRPRMYHRNKQLLCEEQGFQLITVFEDEWRYARSAVEGMIMTRFGVFREQLDVQECVLMSVSEIDACQFLQNYHLQGEPARYEGAWGLYVAGELVAVAVLAISDSQGSLHEQTAVLCRLCYKSGVSVVGGTTQLLQMLKKEGRNRGCVRLLAWSDNRWTSGDVYARLGFTLEESLLPDYTYVVVAKPRRRLSKQSQKRDAMQRPEGLTDHEWATERGLARVWDCGWKRWVLPLE